MGGGREPRSDRQQLRSVIFKMKWPTSKLIALKLSQNIAKSMVYIVNQSCGDFQQGGCLYKSTNGIQWTPEHSWMSHRPQKQASAKAGPSKFGCVYWYLLNPLICVYKRFKIATFVNLQKLPFCETLIWYSTWQILTQVSWLLYFCFFLCQTIFTYHFTCKLNHQSIAIVFLFL